MSEKEIKAKSIKFTIMVIALLLVVFGGLLGDIGRDIFPYVLTGIVLSLIVIVFMYKKNNHEKR